MGNTYTAVPTKDDSDVLAASAKEFGHSRSITFMEKHPIIRTPVHNDNINCLAGIRSGMVVSCSADKTIVLNNIDTGECVLRWTGHEKEVSKVIYKHNGGKHYLLSGSRDTTIKLWMFNQSFAIKTYEGHNMSVMGLAPIDETKFVSGARDATLKIWDVNTGQIIRNALHNRNMVTHIENIPEVNLLCQTSEDRALKLWDNRDLSLVHQFPRKDHILFHCDVLPDSLYCVTSCGGYNNDGCEITLWDLRQRKMLSEFKGHEDSVKCSIFLPQQVTWKRLILSVSDDRTVRVWNTEDGKCLWKEIIPTKSDLTSCVGFADGNVAVSGANATLCHLRLLGKAGRPLLHCVSLQSTFHRSTCDLR
uniref:Uncharacterized protein n=1 Tax=Acrobeloides nanus TaxID=290746 RepID=A0A914DFL1_9BILA